MPRNGIERLRRVVRAYDLLKAKGPKAAEFFADYFGVAIATTYKDLSAIKRKLRGSGERLEKRWSGSDYQYSLKNGKKQDESKHG